MFKKEKEKRVKIVMALMSMVFIAILSKLFYEQIFHHQTILEKAQNLWERDFHISGIRGSILDCNGVVLAQDILSTSLVVVPSQIKDAQDASNKIAPILNMNENDLYKRISKNVSTQKIQPEGRLLSEEQVDKIEALKLKGVYLVQDSKRYYPFKNYLAQTLGFAGIDNQGLAGLELAYDEYLKAEKGSLQLGFDAKGGLLQKYDEKKEASGRGNDLVLTIDKNIQDIVEREMNNLMKRYDPKQAFAIAMNPQNGEILALVSKPDFDPNHYKQYSQQLINRNLPIWMNFEPGSTFKSVTFASALDANCFDMMKDIYHDVGYEIVEGARIKSWKRGGHGTQTFLQVLENSSNPGFVEISRRLGLEQQYAYIQKFGFGQKTGIDLPGESSGIMFKKANMGLVEQACVAFGQGISVTPIQLVSAFSAIVNGGNLYEPHIMKYVLNASTQEVMKEGQVKLKQQVISKDTSKKMAYALESVVANGGAKTAYIEGYKIGGKTGTAQKVANGVYLSNEYILSMIAALPMENPEVVLFIAADSVNSDVQYGSNVIGPLIKNCMEDIIAYLNIKPSEEQIPKKTTWLDVKKYKVGNYVGLTKKDIKEEHLKIVFIGEGDEVIEQMPQAGVVLEEGKEIWLYLNNK